MRSLFILSLLWATTVVASPATSTSLLLQDPIRAQDPSHQWFQHDVSSMPYYGTGVLNTILANSGRIYLDRSCTNFTYVTYIRQCSPLRYEQIQSGQSSVAHFRLGEGIPITHFLLTPQWSKFSNHYDLITGEPFDNYLNEIELDSSGNWTRLNALTNVVTRGAQGADFGTNYYFKTDWSVNPTNILTGMTHSWRERAALTLGVYTDHDLDITIGLWEKTVVASNGIQVIQLNPEVGSGHIAVSTDPSAHVELCLIDRDNDGFSHVSMTTTYLGSGSGSGFGSGMMQDQGDFAQIVWEVAIVDPTHITMRGRCCWEMVDSRDDPDRTRWRMINDVTPVGITIPHFEPGAGIDMTMLMGGIEEGAKWECYGTKIFPNRLLTLEECNAMYDVDKQYLINKYHKDMYWREPVE